MFVKDIMTTDPACCSANTGLQEVAQKMLENDCGCVPVVDGDGKKPIGIVTDRDIALRAVAIGKNPLDLTAGDVMTKKVVSVSPDVSLEDCCGLMEGHQLRRIAVVDGNGACCGIVSQADIAANAAGRKTAEVVQKVSRASA